MPAFHSSLPVVCFSAFRRLRSLVSRGLLSHRRAPRAASVYPALAAIFAAQFYGIHLDFTQYLLIVLVSVLGSAATAGTTGAIVMLTLTLSTLGLPLDGVGLLMAIDPIIDMGRTALNVASQTLVPAVVARREGILDETLYNAPRSEGGFVPEALYEEQVADEPKRLQVAETR